MSVKWPACDGKFLQQEENCRFEPKFCSAKMIEMPEKLAKDIYPKYVYIL